MRLECRIGVAVAVIVLGATCRGSAREAPAERSLFPDATLDWTRPIPASPPGPGEADYAGTESCRACHEDIADRYARHSMARTGLRAVADVDAAWLARAFDAGESGSVLHEASGFRYRPQRDGDRYFVEEYLLGPDGARVHSRVLPITHTYASGTSGMAFYSRSGDRYHHVPIDYFPKLGRWELDPGFLHRNPRFSSTLEVYCISCHSDAPRRSETAPDVFYDPLPPGVGCERCHGPGKAHVDSGGLDAIVNPARLPPARQLDVCTQCHLDIASVLRTGRRAFDYRPGEPLDAFRANYLPEPAEPDRITLLAHAGRLVRSPCFVESRGKLVCTTCHDAHESSHERPASAWRAACESCHQEDGCSESHAARAVHADDCIACHMRAGPAEDAPHVTVTDHWIQRRPPPIRPGPAATPARLVRWSAYLGEPSAAGDDDLAVEAIAYDRAGLAAGAELRALRAVAARADVPGVYELVATRLQRRGRPDDATRALAAGLRVDPDRRAALLDYALAMLDAGTAAAAEQAEQALDRVLALDPEHQDALEILGMVRLRAGREAEARVLLTRAAGAGPDGAAARVGLAALALRDGRSAEAIEHLEAARRIEPADAWILDRLAAAYSALDDRSRAEEVERARAGLTGAGRTPSPTPTSLWLPSELR